jgi:hypothetical protein
MLMSGWTGLDFSKYGPDEPILHSRQASQLRRSKLSIGYVALYLALDPVKPYRRVCTA